MSYVIILATSVVVVNVAELLPCLLMAVMVPEISLSSSRSLITCVLKELLMVMVSLCVGGTPLQRFTRALYCTE